MIDLSKKKVLCWDHGLFHCLAERLSRDFGEVYYFVPWESSFPTPEKAVIGQGIPGITRVDSFWDYVDKVDIICFFDIYAGNLQEYLRKKGYRVFGTGNGEKLEVDRAYFRKILKSEGLPVTNYKIVKSVDGLKNYLKPLKDKWIKISTFRGIGETFHFKDFKSTFPELDTLAYKLGAYQNVMEFIVEDPIKGVEVGIDWFVSDGKHLSSGMFGYELKDAACIEKAITYEKLPTPIKEVTDIMEGAMSGMGIRGLVSSEIRIDKDQEPFYTDACMRAPSPPGELQSEMYENFSEIVWKVAGGESVTPLLKAKFGAEVVLKSDWSRENWMAIEYPKSNMVKFRNMCNIDGTFYHVPTDKETLVGAVIGLGDTLEEAQGNALDLAKEIKAQDIFFEKACFEDLDEILKEAKGCGLGKF